MASKNDDNITIYSGLNKGALDFIKTDLDSMLLKPLDEALRCRICYEYFNNCMITKCSHNYCSVCIRRYMLYKAQCPTCFQEASEPELRNNRLLDEILRIYIKIKDTLENATQIKSEPHEEFSNLDPPASVKIKKEVLTLNENKPDEIECKTETENAGLITSDVSCPVCYQTVLADRINIHLDRCLSKENSLSSERKQLPKLVYHLMSEREIKKRLKEHGLSMSGNRQTLIRRHKNFIVLYNANCDALNPKPVNELIKEIEIQEVEERLNSVPKQTQVNKKSDISAIEKEHELHVKKHQSQFHDLIIDVQQRELNRITVKKEMHEDNIQSCDPPAGSTSENFRNITGETSSVENLESECKSTTSHSKYKTTCESNRNEEKLNNTKAKSIEENTEMSHEKSEQESISSFQVKDVIEFTKSSEKIHDSLTKDSPSSLEDFETGKIQLSLLRKRKKGRISLDKRQCSPSKK